MSSSVRKPLGLLPYKLFHTPFYYSSTKGCRFYERFYRKFQFQFTLHFSFNSNLSLDKLYTSLENDRMCDYGGVSIFGKYGKIVKGKRTNRRRSQDLTFCGIHSKITVFPKAHPRFTISIYIQKPRSYVSVSLAYSVIDSNTIHSEKVQTWRTRLSHKVPVIQICTYKSICFQQYKLRVEHFKQIRLVFPKAFPGLYHVCDGPGEKYGLVIYHSNSRMTQEFISSTFQVVVMVTSTRKHQIHFVAMVNFQIYNNLSVDSLRRISFPSTVFCKQSSFCILQLKTTKKTAVNITMTDFSFSGDVLTENCSHAGLAFYDETNTHSFSLSYTECIKYHTGLIHHGHCFRKLWKTSQEVFLVENFSKFEHTYPQLSDNKAFVSMRNTLLAVFYHYKGYGDLNLTMFAFSTQCAGVTIDTCEVFTSLSGDSMIDFVELRSSDSFEGSMNTLELKWHKSCYMIFLFRSGNCETNFFCSLSRSFDDFAGCTLTVNLEQTSLLGRRMSVISTGVLTDPSAVEIHRDFLLHGDRDNLCNETAVANRSNWPLCACVSQEILHWSNIDSERCTFSTEHSIVSPISKDRHRYVA